MIYLQFAGLMQAASKRTDYYLFFIYLLYNQMKNTKYIYTLKSMVEGVVNRIRVPCEDQPEN